MPKQERDSSKDPILCESCNIGQLHFMAQTQERDGHNISLFECKFCESISKFAHGLVAIIKRGMYQRKVSKEELTRRR